MTSTIVFQIQSFIIVALMFWGASLWRQRSKHIKTQALAMGWDILLILQIELNRHAVEKAIRPMENSLWLNIHVSLAVTCVIMYALMLASGLKVLKGDLAWRVKHKWLGRTTLLLRLLVLITSFLAKAT